MTRSHPTVQLHTFPTCAILALATALCLAPIRVGAQENVAEIPDAKTRDAVLEIQRKLADVENYSCQAEFAQVMKIGKPGQEQRIALADQAEVIFKRPNLGHRRSKTLNHLYSWFEGQVTDTYFDGTYWWQFQQPAADSGEKLANARKMEAGFERNLYIEAHNEPKVYRYELQAFSDAGLNNQDRDRGDILLRPFAECDMASLRIDREDNDVYVFTAKPRRVYPMRKEYTAIRMTIGKADGLIREAFYDSGEEHNRTVIITDVRLNPGFDDAVFRFTPPEGVEVNDKTEMMTQSLIKQREDWEKANLR